MATLTLLGTKSRDVGTNSISINGGTIPAGSMIIATCAYLSGTTPNNMKFDGEKLRRAGQRTDNTNGFGLTTFISHVFQDEKTGDLICNFGEDVGSLILLAYTIDVNYIEDQISRNIQIDSDTPHCNFTSEHAFRDSLAFTCLCANGPETDNTVAWGAGWIVGERKGTTLVADTDNVTLSIAYQFLTSAEAIRARAINATSRNWANVCTILRPAIFPIVDTYEYEIEVADTVLHNSTEYTVLGITRIMGTIGVVDLGSDISVYSYDVIKVVD